jgi:hypothetical protein
MVRRVSNLRMAYLNKANVISIHDNIVTWRKNAWNSKEHCYPKDMTTPNISRTCPVVTVESSTSFKASLSIQVTVKPSPAASKSAWGHLNRLASGYLELDSPIAACSWEWSPEIDSTDCLASRVHVYQKMTHLGRRKLSYHDPRKWNQSLYTCAQDVQFTRIVTIWYRCNVR